jgi:hypothetical protein
MYSQDPYGQTQRIQILFENVGQCGDEEREDDTIRK